jgi:CNT family concentrative nucleoside transporter
MQRTMKLSGAESFAAAANVFVGQTEAPLMVKPYLKEMTRSEVCSLLISPSWAAKIQKDRWR